MTNVHKELNQHLRIAEFLIREIRDGVYKENEKIPSENELCRKFNVNRHVVRQAIGRITSLGWVTPLQGKGCYINKIPRPIQYVLSPQTRFSENMENQGVQHKSKLLSWEKCLPTKEECHNLLIEEREQVYRLEILRYVDDLPISITTSVFPEIEVPQMEDFFDSFHSLYGLLQTHYHFRPIRSKSIFQASLPLLKDADVLQIPENIPIVEIASIMNHPGGAPVEYSVARVRSDMNKCLVEF
jgi:DNA-binding GntR family transcriptional regulator